MPILSPGKGDHLYWQYDCTTITIGSNMPEYIFSMRLQDNESTTTGTYYTISLPTPKWQVPGVYVNDLKKCYVPIFPHGLDKEGDVNNDWYFGAHAIIEEVIVFDNTPFTDHSAQYAQMGFSKSAGLSQDPLIEIYGNPADGGVVKDDSSLMSDSSIY